MGYSVKVGVIVLCCVCKRKYLLGDDDLPHALSRVVLAYIKLPISFFHCISFYSMGVLLFQR